jgi:hypothetical protein
MSTWDDIHALVRNRDHKALEQAMQLIRTPPFIEATRVGPSDPVWVAIANDDEVALDLLGYQFPSSEQREAQVKLAYEKLYAPVMQRICFDPSDPNTGAGRFAMLAGHDDYLTRAALAYHEAGVMNVPSTFERLLELSPNRHAIILYRCFGQSMTAELEAVCNRAMIKLIEKPHRAARADQAISDAIILHCGWRPLVIPEDVTRSLLHRVSDEAFRALLQPYLAMPDAFLFKLAADGWLPSPRDAVQLINECRFALVEFLLDRHSSKGKRSSKFIPLFVEELVNHIRLHGRMLYRPGMMRIIHQLKIHENIHLNPDYVFITVVTLTDMLNGDVNNACSQ